MRDRNWSEESVVWICCLTTSHLICTEVRKSRYERRSLMKRPCRAVLRLCQCRLEKGGISPDLIWILSNVRALGSWRFFTHAWSIMMKTPHSFLLKKTNPKLHLATLYNLRRVLYFGPRWDLWSQIHVVYCMSCMSSLGSNLWWFYLIAGTSDSAALRKALVPFCALINILHKWEVSHMHNRVLHTHTHTHQYACLKYAFTRG